MSAGEMLLEKARVELSHVFGFPSFRPGQEEILRAVLGGEDVLAVMPTGSGKSLCFQLPPLAREGLTLVVSPLIALMRDQVAQLRELGVSAAALNSASEAIERQRIFSALENRSLRLLYVAPERLTRDDTLEMLSRLPIDLFAIDEAHCVSQWGHDFRPEYLRLREVAQTLGRPQTIAVTATADAPTRGDIVERLWDQTVERARRLPPELLHESVDSEWSFTETLRHLTFATDAWVRRAILGDPAPWDPLGLPWGEMPDTPGVPHDREARPDLDTVLALRRDRMATVREVIDSLTDE